MGKKKMKKEIKSLKDEIKSMEERYYHKMLEIATKNLDQDKVCVNPEDEPVDPSTIDEIEFDYWSVKSSIEPIQDDADDDNDYQLSRKFSDVSGSFYQVEDTSKEVPVGRGLELLRNAIRNNDQFLGFSHTSDDDDDDLECLYSELSDDVLYFEAMGEPFIRIKMGRVFRVFHMVTGLSYREYASKNSKFPRNIKELYVIELSLSSRLCMMYSHI